MTDVRSVSAPACPHARWAIEFERTGSYLHQIAWIVMRCGDCSAELDRKRATRGDSTPASRGKD
jgi:hypothetical protein